MATAARSRRALAAALLAGLTAACGEDKITGGAELIHAGRDFGMDPSTARGAPSGPSAITNYEITSISSTLAADAFQRGGTSGARIGYGTPACPGLGGNRCWNFRTWVRVAPPPDGAVPADPRLPAMVNSPGRDSVGFFDVGGPEYFGGSVKAFELFFRLFGLAPSADYFMSLVRYGLVVRGQLDAVEMLVFGRVTQPDSLVLLSPNPQGNLGGADTTYEWKSNIGCNDFPVPVGANPFLLGPTRTTTAGRATFDKCFASGNIYYKNGTTVVPDSSPFFPNSLNTPRIAQQYNYVEITRGNTPGGPVVARVQVGADIDPSTGRAIPNAFAPFPAAALSPGVLISQLKVAEGAPSGVRVSVLPLDSLAGSAEYRILLVDRESGTTQQVNARYYRVRRDTTGRDENGNPIIVETVSETTTVNAIRGGASNVTHVIHVHDSLNAGVRLGSFTDVALQPPAAATGAPVFARYLDRNRTSGTTQDDRFFDPVTLQLGTLPFVADAQPYVFRVAGSGLGTNRGTEVGIAFSHLPRPPIGFMYRVWIVPTDAAAAPVMLGGLTTPLPEQRSLDDADVAPNGGVLTTNEILSANLLVREADLRALGVSLDDFATVRLTLEAKDGVPTISPIVVLEGPFPTP